MIHLRPAAERGHSQHGWLDSHHSFSFADYYDPRHMGYSNLRVINEDTVAPGQGFATHGHRDMEIVTYLLSGALEHKDSLGNGSVIRPGEVQRMSAGTGVRHSEFNPSASEPVHLLQIWLLPNHQGGAPGYAQRYFPENLRRNRLCLLVSPDGRGESLAAQQDGLLYGALLSPGQALEHRPDPGRRTYLHLAQGALEVNGRRLDAGDGARVEDVPLLSIGALSEAELLLFDLP